MCGKSVEPPNAWIKQILGFRQFSLRGVEKVRCEFKLVCAALNHAAHGNDGVLNDAKHAHRCLWSIDPLTHQPAAGLAGYSVDLGSREKPFRYYQRRIAIRLPRRLRATPAFRPMAEPSAPWCAGPRGLRRRDRHCSERSRAADRGTHSAASRWLAHRSVRARRE